MRLALAVVLALPLVSQAATQTVLGRALRLKNPSTPDKRKIVVKAREPASDNTIVGDPTTDGATLVVVVRGATIGSQTFALPAGTNSATGRPFWTGDATNGFRYRDARGENGAVKSADIGLVNGVFRIDAAVDGRRGPVSLVPPSPGTDGCAVLTIGKGDAYSIKFASGRVQNHHRAFFGVTQPTDQGSCLLDVACLGDSNTAGGWPTPDTLRWCEYAQTECPSLQDGTPVVWHDFGIGGAVVAPGPYIDYEMGEAHAIPADVVVLAFGTNDVHLLDETPSEYAANVVTACGDATAACFVMSMPPHQDFDYASYNAAVADVVPSELLIDRTTGMTFVDDGVHLDDPSQRELARRARTAICGY